MERRDFIKFLPAAFIAIAAGCRRPEEKIVPRIYPGKHTKAGVPEYFNTLYSYGSVCYGITAKLYDGRPVKIDGNTEHPVNRGKSNAQIQASLYSLYDPKRFNKPRIGGSEVSLNEAKKYFLDSMQSSIQKNEQIRIVLSEHCSPSLAALIEQIEGSYSNIKFILLPLVKGKNDQRDINRKYFNRDSIFIPDISKHKNIISFGADFLHADPNMLRNSINFDKSKSNIYTFESAYTVTGANSQFRYSVSPPELERIVESLLYVYLINQKRDYIISKLNIENYNEYSKQIKHIIDNTDWDFVVICGDYVSIRCRELAAILNYLLWEDKQYDGFFEISIFDSFISSSEDIEDFTKELENGEISKVFIYDVDIVYSYFTLMYMISRNIGMQDIFTSSLYKNKTNYFGHCYIPSTHYLESWGDGITYDGFRSIKQPMILPLNTSSIAFEDLLIECFTDYSNYYDFLRKEWKPISKDNSSWETILRKGFVHTEQAKPSEELLFNLDQLSISEKGRITEDELFFLLIPSNNLSYGEFSENNWLLELPDPITKTVWESYAFLNKDTADKYSLMEGDEIEIIDDDSIIATMPVCIIEEIANNCIMSYMGYDKQISMNKLDKVFRTNLYRNIPVIVSINKTHNKEKILRTNPSKIRIEDLHFSSNKNSEKSSYKYKNHKWTMVIDTNKCIGCNTCIVACQIENNIAIVGKEEIEKNRSLHWIRIENATDDTGNISFIPIMCQHCDNAPCEKVCPVSATSHSPEGINEMTYNRCIGTRFCMANCPYDVRRFNFKEYHNKEEQLYQFIYNPNVTVRMRGIVEKCTFCVQRINEEKYKQKNKGNNKIPDGAFQTACQQACPTSAITFGNILDKQSDISKKIAQKKNYRMLEELNTDPSVLYILKNDA
jgi:Fe-S-cluster-containing dehydrogenase component